LQKVLYSTEAKGVSPSNIHSTIGKHIIIELSDCNKDKLSDLEFVKRTMEESVRRAKATIIDSKFHKFSPVGVSGIILLAESHASIHTWPETDQGSYASLDIYTCGEDVLPEDALKHIIKEFEAKSYCLTSLKRGTINSAENCHYSHQIEAQATKNI